MTGDRPRRDVTEVRPYVITGGRVRGERDDLRLDSLVQETQGAPVPVATLTAEQRAILAGMAGAYATVAEIASRLELPLGVARILVGDLVRAGALQVHDSGLPAVDGGDPTADAEARYLVLDLLESVYDGISAL